MTSIFQLLGGLGLFLLGMSLLTDGLKAYAGDALRRVLMQLTGRPLRAFASGVLITTLVQSSSATTVAVIGFVSAGILALPQAVGLVLGASVGTSSTGWIVAVLGLKISIGLYALPVIAIGAFMRLLARGPLRAMGLALAGFGLVFVGIDMLQQGMQEVGSSFELAKFPSSGFLARLLMVGIGVLLTVVMQSSSAAVATTLTALHASTVNFEQAAALVIGAAIGTTVTSALAAIGASISAKRTALAHVCFNLGTGLFALLMLPLFLQAISWAQTRMGLEPGALSLAAFQTMFLGLGALVILPFVPNFARWLERILPEKEPSVTRHLDRSVLKVPAVAIEATQRALAEVAEELFAALEREVSDPHKGLDSATLARIDAALDQIEQFLASIPHDEESKETTDTRVAALHAVDHLARLKAHARAPEALRVHGAELEHATRLTREQLAACREGVSGRDTADWVSELQQRAAQIADIRRQQRPKVFVTAATQGWEPAQTLGVLDAMRWLDRISYHAWRICRYLSRPADIAEETHEQRLPPEEL